MTTQQTIKNDHYSFACEVVNGLNKFYSIPVEMPQHSEDDCFFTNDIRWAIVTISYFFRKDFLKVFNVLEKGLENKRQFEKYCMIISVSRNSRYFFNFLRRVSLIYEMAVYCYKNGNDYFKKARNCIAQYHDKVYFQSSGSWSGLNKIASFLRELGNPFLLVILEENTIKCPLSFSATVERIESRLKRQCNEVILNSKEMNFLIEQKEKCIARERDKTKIYSQTEKERASTQILTSNFCMSSTAADDEFSITAEKQAIMEYFKSLLFSGVSDKLNELKTPLECTKYEGSNVSQLFKPFELEKSCTDTKLKVPPACDHLTTDSASVLNKESVVDEHFQSHPNFDEQQKESECSGTYNEMYLTPSSLKRFPTQIKLSDKSNAKVNKSSNLIQINVDSFLPVASSGNENTEMRNLKTFNDDNCLSFKCGLYSSNESIIAESLSSRKKMNSPENETSSSHLLEDVFLSGCSSEDENTQQCSSKKKILDRRNTLRVVHRSDSSIESNNPNFQSSTERNDFSENDDSHLKLLEEDLYKRATLFSLPHFSSSEELSLEQSVLNNYERDEDDSSVAQTASYSRIVIDLHLMRGAHGETSQATSSERVKPIDNTEMKVSSEKSECNSNTNVKNSLSSSQHRPGRKNRRKKKGKRK